MRKGETRARRTSCGPPQRTTRLERMVWPWCTLRTDCGFGLKEPGKSQNIRLSPPPQADVAVGFRHDSFLIRVGCVADGFLDAQLACWLDGAHDAQGQVGVSDSGSKLSPVISVVW